MEMIKSLKKNLALKIMILHLLHDPMIFKEGVQSLIGGNTGLLGVKGVAICDPVQENQTQHGT